MKFEEAKPLYWLPQDNLAEEVLIPGFSESISVDCMFGFFSSEVLADLAPGLATYLQKAPASLRIVVSPFLSKEDQVALEAGLREPEEIASDVLINGLITVEDLQRHTLTCLSYLLAAGRIELKVALMRNALFHPKVWIFQTQKGQVAAHGSSNMTMRGIRKNKEQISVSKSWSDPTQKYVVGKFAEEFERLWQNKDDDCKVLELPDAVKDKILREYPAGNPPTEDDFRELYRRASNIGPLGTLPPENWVEPRKPIFSVPVWLKYDEGSYAHQGKAVRKWVEAGFRGTLAMATGSGKTLTSMIGAYRLYESHKPLLVLIAAPYIPLIQQWCGEIELFGLRPIDLTTIGNATERAQILQRLRRRLHLGQSDIEVVVVSHKTLCTSEFISAVREFQCQRLLIADEAHNLGRESFIQAPPNFIEHRLALSATPVRQYDPEGTKAIFDYFGPPVFEFTLQDAIGTCLVEYDYFPHPVELTPTEMDNWKEITEKIHRNAWRQTDGQSDTYMEKLLRDRRELLETAQGKLRALSNLLDQEDIKTFKHTLIYTSDKAPEQLIEVNRLLKDKNILFHQLTAEETSDRGKIVQIIQSFQRGEIRVLTAKRVLDEGVNIPQVTKAYILASTTVERQWIQRRGRLLRMCKEIGKTHSIIHDFLAIPPYRNSVLDEDARDLIKSELRRVKEFASLARNAGAPDGPLHVIYPLIQAFLM